MKKLFILLGAALLAACNPLNAQTTNGPSNPSPQSPSTFLGDVQSYFTSFGTNTWNGTKGFVATGAAYQHNINFGNEMELGIAVKNFSTNATLYADAKAINALGLGGVLGSELGLKYAYKIHDVQAFVGIDGGYGFQAKSAEGSISLGLQKKLTQNTFAYISFDPTLSVKSVKDYLIFGVGFTF